MLLCAAVQEPQSEPRAQSFEWPREVVRDGYRVIAYQPQIESWEDYTTVRGVMAVEVHPEDGEQASFGAVHLRANTLADFKARLVHVKDIEVERIDYPAAPVKMENVEAVVRSVFGEDSLLISLDGVLAGLVRGQQLQREVEVGMDPPPIFHSPKPAVLVQFLGRPRLAPLPKNDLQFVWNTNWDVVTDPKTSRYYVLVGDAWVMSANGIRGPWMLADTLPIGLTALPDDLNWARARQNVPGRRTGPVPQVLVSRRPAELILTDGPAQLAEIAGTGLSYVSNTESDVFWRQADGTYYFTVAGRWFRAPKLGGPWTAASADLPAEFGRIPPDHAKSHVLVAVPGTTAAREAVIQCSIPRQARVVRSTAVSVTYDGAPQFEKIPETMVSYAKNTRYDVFRVDGDPKVYLCFKAIWFVANSPGGKWSVCDAPPVALYSIPPAHPKHHVTYVFVYSATPDQVVVGYTAGYKGTFVCNGVPVFGVGYWSSPTGSISDATVKWASYWPSYYWGYGSGAVYSFANYGFVRAHRGYGPHGGAGRGAISDPGQHAWVRSDNAYGPTDGPLAAAGHNPWGAAYGKRLEGAHGYASWGRSVSEADRGWARGVEAQPAEKPAAVAPPAKRDRPVLHATEQRGNDVFVGADGNIYMHSKGQWLVRKGDSWEPAKAPSQPDAAVAKQTAGADRAAAEYWQNLGRQQYARERSAVQRQAIGSGNRENKMPPNYIHRWWW